MKIQVVRSDGDTKILNLVGTIKAGEPGANGQGTLLVEETGTTHFFSAEDGSYNGWEMEVRGTESGMSRTDMMRFIDAVEKEREIHQSGKAE